MADIPFPLQFTRQFAGPIDIDGVFATTVELNNYLSSPRRYAGQIATVADSPGSIYVMNDTTDAWIEIQGDGDPIGVTSVNSITGAVSIVGDGETIAVDTSGASITVSVDPAFTSKVDTISGDLGTLEVTVTSLSGDLSVLETRVESVSAAVDAINVVGGDNITVNESPDDTWTISLNQNITGDHTFGNNLTVSGNLYVNGTEFIVNTESVSAEDNQIVINSGEVGAGVTAGFAGIRVDRGTEDPYDFQFRESDDTFVIGVSGDYQAVATREDNPLADGYAQWNDTENRFDTVSSLTVASDISGFLDLGVSNFLDLTDTPATYSPSGYFTVVNGSGDGIEFIDFRGEVENITGQLAVDIFNNSVDITTLNTELTSANNTLTNHEVRITELESDVTDLSGSLGTVQQGTVDCDTVNNVYTVTHAPVTVENSAPVISLSIPNSGSDLYIQGVTNRSVSQFDVVLSSVPAVSGYEINWQMNLTGEAFVVKSYDVGELQGIEPEPLASVFDSFYLEMNQNKTLRLPIGMSNGQNITVMVEQDATGAWTLGFESGYEFSGGVTPTISPSAGAVDILNISKIQDRYFTSYVQDFSAP